jgi:hypothetical protein
VERFNIKGLAPADFDRLEFLTFFKLRLYRDGTRGSLNFTIAFNCAYHLSVSATKYVDLHRFQPLYPFDEFSPVSVDGLA